MKNAEYHYDIQQKKKKMKLTCTCLVAFGEVVKTVRIPHATTIDKLFALSGFIVEIIFWKICLTQSHNFGQIAST